MRWFKKFIGLMVISFCFGQENQATNIYNLKGTLSVLPPVLQDLSVIHGAIAFETGMVRRLYDFGMLESLPGAKPVEPIKPANESEKENKIFLRKSRAYERSLRDYEKRLEAYEKALADCAPVIKLVRYFFYRIPGSTNVVDFQLSAIKFNAVSPSDFAEKMGQLVAAMWWYEWVLRQNVTSADNVKGLLNEDVKTLVEKDPWLSSFRQPLIVYSLDDKKWGKCMPLLVILAAVWVKCGSDKAALQKYNEALIDALKEKLKKFMWIEELRYLGDHKKEDYIRIIEERFRDNEVVLHAKLEKLALYEKNFSEVVALQSALEAFRIPDSWGDVFTVADGKRKLSIDDLKRDSDLAVANYEQFVFQYCFSNIKPRDIGHGQVILEDVDGKMISAFPDCLESVIRNFINNLAYDSALNVFSIEHLKRVTGKQDQLYDELRSLNAGLERFYTEYSNPNNVAEQSVRNAWIKIISNIPWVMYACRHSDKWVVRIPNDIFEENRSRLCEFYKNRYACNVVDSTNEHLLYEMVPNCRNFIVVVDYLLRLGLFARKDVGIEFLRADFIETYLPKIFEQLHGFDLQKNEEQGTWKVFDSNDLHDGAHSIFKVRKIEPPVYDMVFDIYINRHGSFGSLSSYLAVQSDEHTSFAPLDLFPYTFSMLLTEEAYKKIFECGNQDLLAFWAHEVDNPDKVFELVHSENLKIDREFLLNTILFFIGRAEDFLRVILGKLFIYSAAVKGEIKECYQEAMEYIRRYCFTLLQYYEGKSLLLNLLNAFFDKNDGFDVAIGIAKYVMAGVRNDWPFGERLFEELFKRGKGFKEAIEISMKAVHDNHLDLALTLFKLLIQYDAALDREDKDKIYKEAINAAPKSITNHFASEPAFMVFIELVKKNQGVEKAIIAAKAGILSDKDWIRKKAELLFETLFEHGKGFDAARELLEKLGRYDSRIDMFPWLLRKYEYMDQEEEASA